MDWKLEVVPISVFDVGRAKHFYSEQLGFVVDLDTPISDEIRCFFRDPDGHMLEISETKDNGVPKPETRSRHD